MTYKVGVGGKYQAWHAVIINTLSSTYSLDLLIRAIMQFAWILNIRIIDFLMSAIYLFNYPVSAIR